MGTLACRSPSRILTAVMAVRACTVLSPMEKSVVRSLRRRPHVSLPWLVQRWLFTVRHFKVRLAIRVYYLSIIGAPQPFPLLPFPSSALLILHFEKDALWLSAAVHSC